MSGDSRRGMIKRGILILIMTVFCSAAAMASTPEQQVFSFVTSEMGLSPAAACGIMANIAYESGFSPTIVGPGGSYGLCQWLGGRKSNLVSWCQSHGCNSASISGQMRFLQYELTNVYPSVYNQMRSVSNSAAGAYQAAYNWCYYYEIPADRAGQSAVRAARARDYYWPNFGSGAFFLSSTMTRGGVKLHWAATKGATVEISRSLSKSKGFSVIAKVSSKEGGYEDRTVKKNRTYYYKITLVEGKKKKTSNTISASVSERKLKAGSCKIKLDKTKLTYNGQERHPKITVTYRGITLKKGTDYTVTYKHAVNVGKATVGIKGIGLYGGKMSAEFTIKKAKQTLKVSKDLKVDIHRMPLRLETGAKTAVSFKSSNPKVAKGGKAITLVNPGRTKVTVTAKGSRNYLAAKKTFTLTVLPPDCAIHNFTQMNGADVEVHWAEMSGIKCKLTGYEVQYALNGEFTQGVVKKTVLAGKGNKCKITGWNSGEVRFLRVRSFCKSGKKSLYGRWSDTVEFVL